MRDFQIAFGNGTSKRIGNGATSKPVRLRSRLKTHKSMVSAYEPDFSFHEKFTSVIERLRAVSRRLRNITMPQINLLLGHK